jgi:hypothetical protein
MGRIAVLSAADGGIGLMGAPYAGKVVGVILEQR